MKSRISSPMKGRMKSRMKSLAKSRMKTDPIDRPDTRRRLWRLVRPLLSLMALAVVTTCSGDGPPSGPPGPDVGMMEVRVPEAASGTGIMVLEITGSRSGPVEPVSPATLWSSDGSGDRVVVVIRAATLPGPVARFRSPDREGGYSVRVLEAAAGPSQEYAVLDPADFTTTLVPVN